MRYVFIREIVNGKTVFPERSFLLLCNFFSKIALHVVLNFICNYSVSLICIGLHMNFKQSRHAFLSKKGNESSGQAMSN